MGVEEQNLIRRLEVLEEELRQSKSSAMMRNSLAASGSQAFQEELISERDFSTFRNNTVSDSTGEKLSGVKQQIEHRRSLKKALGVNFAAGPVWDMLLELYLARQNGDRICIKILTLASDVPATTALRWIGEMEKEGLIAKQRDTEDRRRIFVRLTPEATRKVSSLI